MPEVILGQLEGFVVQRHAHILADARGEGGAGVAAQDGADAGQHRGGGHQAAGAQHGVKGSAGGALVEHLGRQRGDEQRARRVHDQQQHRDDAQPQMRFEKTCDQFHGRFPFR